MNPPLAGAERIRQLAPAGPDLPVEELLAWPLATAAPFAAGRRASLDLLSAAILRHPVLRADAGSVALAYWLRRSNVTRLAREFEQRAELSPEIVFVPAGRIFHVAPANVDTMFVYCWALAYLCGNQNVVRLSGKTGAVITGLLEVLSALMARVPELAASNRFVTYGHQGSINAAFSRWASHRVVWGGDETVSELRAMPLSPHASERSFASKYSYCVVSAAAFLVADEVTVARLAVGFFNDVFWFDQMACSSPHEVVWVGDRATADTAMGRFDAALQAEIDRRGYTGGPANAMRRLNFAFDLACGHEITANLGQREFLALRAGDGLHFQHPVCGAGLFFHRRLERLEELARLTEPRDQTITHFGFSHEELCQLAVAAGPAGIDRLVPIGEALAFSADWDGYNLIADFLRRVTVRTL